MTLPFRLRIEKTLDDPSLQTLFYGPINLVGRNSATDYLGGLRQLRLRTAEQATYAP